MSGLYDTASNIWHSLMKNKLSGSNKGVISFLTDLSKDITYFNYSRIKPENYPKEISKWYTKMTGKAIDLNNPVTYNEKMQYEKAYDSVETKKKKAFLSDKYAVRQWIAEKLGEEHLIPILGVYDSFDEIDFDSLPDKFVLKANHASGWNIIVSDKNNFDKKAAKKKFDKWMKRDFSFWYGFQTHYRYIDRKIVCEKYLENDGELDDYKFLCFNGKPYYVWKDVGRYHGHCRNVYDTDWNLVDMKYGYPNTDEPIAPPETLREMTEAARLLSEGFPQVRVDFYEVDGRMYFGELTFTSTSGVKQFTPEDWDERLGKLFEVK